MADVHLWGRIHQIARQKFLVTVVVLPDPESASNKAEVQTEFADSRDEALAIRDGKPLENIARVVPIRPELRSLHEMACGY